MARLSRLTLVMGAACVPALFAAPALAGGPVQTIECQGSSNCRTATGPWVQVPAPSLIVAANQVTATWAQNCGGDWNVGVDWRPDPNDVRQDVVVLYQQTPGNLILDPGAFGVEYLAYNTNTSRALTFQPLLGCSPNPPPVRAAASRAGGRHVSRVRTATLRPSRAHTITHGCRAGERLVRSAHGIGFFTERAPSAQQLAQVSSTRRHVRGRVVVRVRTGAGIGGAPVRTQVHAVCRRAT
jgi:hypothetical protein